MFACEAGHEEVVASLIKYKANVDAIDVYGVTPLHIACMKGQAEIATMLIEHKAGVNAQVCPAITCE